ncbi:MAG: phenylalanine--tRNA ligase subunit beta [Nanoarchaeota archaeon]
MATLNFNKKEIEKYIKVDNKMIEKSTMMGAPAELNEANLAIEVTPNRPDLLSMQGFLRAYKAFIGKESGLKKYIVHKPEKDFKIKIDSSVKNVRPYTACAIVKGIKFDDEKIKEIIDVQEKLHITIGRNRKKAAIGIYPLEKITLPIKFEALKPENIKFIPLEMSEELNGIQILQRHPTGREYAPLLTGLDKYPVFVDAKGKILSMPPVINSNETRKISESTRDVFIECSGFDFSVLKKIINIIVTILADMGGKIYAMELDYGKKELTPNLEPEKIKINIDNVNKLLGLNLKEKDIEKLLPKMGYDYKNGTAFIPAWRTDVLHEVDVIEDIAIAYGYDKIIPEIPNVATIGGESRETVIGKKIAEILTGLGLLEISTYHLIKDEEAKLAKLSNNKIEVENSKTEYKILRPNLMIPALRILSENKDNEYPQKIFELGTVFDKNERSETGIDEKEHLIIAYTPGNFTEIKQCIDYLMKMLDIKYEIKEGKHDWLIDGRTGQVIVKKFNIGYIGEVHPNTLRNWNIKMPVSLVEIDLDEMFKALS